MKLLNIFFLQFLIISAIFCCLASNEKLFAANQPSIQIQLVTPDKVSSGELSKARLLIKRTEEDQTTEFTFKLSTNNSSLIELKKTEIKLLSGEERAEFDFGVLGTPINTSASIKVQLSSRTTQAQAENTLQIVPAMLKSVTTQPSMIGTHGAKVEVSVELRGTAPIGGVKIYVSPFFVAGLLDVTTPLLNIQIPAGSNKTSFLIEYDKIDLGGFDVSRIETNTNFNQQKRTVEFVVAVDPQQSSGSKVSLQWQPIPLIAIKTKFDVIPLQVSSISVQPTTINGGNEALGNFTLNVAPGNSEKIFFRPRRSSAYKLWIKPLGSSCQESESTNPENTYQNQSVEIPLTQGVTNYSFKVCTAPVTTATSVNIQAFLRSGVTRTAVTVQP